MDDIMVINDINNSQDFSQWLEENHKDIYDQFTIELSFEVVNNLLKAPFDTDTFVKILLNTSKNSHIGMNASLISLYKAVDDETHPMVTSPVVHNYNIIGNTINPYQNIATFIERHPKYTRDLITFKKL